MLWFISSGPLKEPESLTGMQLNSENVLDPDFPKIKTPKESQGKSPMSRLCSRKISILVISFDFPLAFSNFTKTKTLEETQGKSPISRFCSRKISEIHGFWSQNDSISLQIFLIYSLWLVGYATSQSVYSIERKKKGANSKIPVIERGCMSRISDF